MTTEEETIYCGMTANTHSITLILADELYQHPNPQILSILKLLEHLGKALLSPYPNVALPVY